MAEKQSRIRVLILGLGVVAALTLLLWQDRGQEPVMVRLKQKVIQARAILGQQKTVVAIAPLQIDQKNESSPSILPPVKDEVKNLNDKGVDLVLKKQCWPGIFLFKQAMDLDPSRIEPVMNMAVTLGEIGLSLPAARYLSMAETMDPNYPLLRIIRQMRQDRMQSVSPEQSPELPNDQKR
jgi:hypothetical protein